MKYTLFVYNDEAQMASAPAPALQQVKAAFEAYTQSLKDAGVFVTSDWLRPSSTATMRKVTLPVPKTHWPTPLPLH